MPRFASWLAVGIAAAFLVVASVSFSLGAVAPLAFAISAGTFVVSVGVAYSDRSYVTSVYTAALIALVSAWTIVASLVFAASTVQHLALASSLAIAALATVGLTAHEVSLERAAAMVKGTSAETDNSTEREGRLVAA